MGNRNRKVYQTKKIKKTMKNILLIFSLTLLFFHCKTGDTITAIEESQQPNIIFILTDDHAFQAISAYGSKINKTPNIDRSVPTEAISIGASTALV